MREQRHSVNCTTRRSETAFPFWKKKTRNVLLGDAISICSKNAFVPTPPSRLYTRRIFKCQKRWTFRNNEPSTFVLVIRKRWTQYIKYHHDYWNHVYYISNIFLRIIFVNTLKKKKTNSRNISLLNETVHYFRIKNNDTHRCGAGIRDERRRASYRRAQHTACPTRFRVKSLTTSPEIILCVHWNHTFEVPNFITIGRPVKMKFKAKRALRTERRKVITTTGHGIDNARRIGCALHGTHTNA